MDINWEYQYPSNHEKLLAYLAEELDFLSGSLEQANELSLQKPKSVQRIYHLACVLWQSLEAYDLTDLLSTQLFDSLLDWTLNTARNTADFHPVKLAVDRVLCSMCAIKPQFYEKLLHNLKIPLTNSEPTASSSTQSVNLPAESINLTENMLKSLGVISLSHVPTLINSEFLPMLINLVIDFTTKNIYKDKSVKFLSLQQYKTMFGDHVVRRTLEDATVSESLETPTTSDDLVSAIFDFFAELCWQNQMKLWLCSEEKMILWEHILRYLCIDVPKKYSNDISQSGQPHSNSVRKLEESTVNFFAKLCSGCFKTQEKFAQTFHKVINTDHTTGLSRFTRRILLDFILSPGYMYVSIETDLPKGMNKILPLDLSALMPPPAFPASRRHQLLYINVDRTCDEILKAVTADEHEFSPAINVDEVAQNICFPSTSKQSGSLEDSPSRKRAQSTAGNLQTKKTKAHNFDRNGRKSYQLMLWERKTSRYANVDRHWSIAEILQKFVPSREEIEIPVLKFLLLNDEKCKEEELSKPSYLLPSPGLQKFLELDGFQLLATLIETKYSNSGFEHSKSWNNTPLSSLIAFGFLMRFPDYRNNPHVRSVIQSLLELMNSKENPFHRVADKIKLIFLNDRANEIRWALPLLPFECLRLCILTNYRKTGSTDLMSVEILNFILMYLTVYAEKPIDAENTLIQEHKMYLKVIQDCYSAKLTTRKNLMQSFWPKGTGYSSSGGENSNATSRQDDEEFIVEMLLVLASFMNPHPQMHTLSYIDFKEDVSNMRFVHSLSPLAVRVIKKSCLMSIIFDYMENFSVFEAAKHLPLYRTLLLLIRIMITNVQLVEMIITPYAKSSENPGTSDEQSIITLLESITKEINEYCEMGRRGEGLRCTEPPALHSIDDPAASLLDKIPYHYASTALRSRHNGLKSSERELFKDVFNTVDIIESITSNLPAIRFPEPKSAAINVKTGSRTNIAKKPLQSTSAIDNTDDERREDDYVRVMKKLQFGQYEMISEENGGTTKLNVSYAFQKSIKKTMVTIPSRLKRIARELSNLSTSLPINLESAIFLRHDESRIDVMKALITGPAGTPYMNGCFEFDIFCPDNYPSSPINVKFQTTGRNSIRFNPNLYNCGKVCLSVLNTWMGGAGEDWNPQTSTILQVLVSIQSMIFISEPYFNEPGFEVNRGTDVGDSASRGYNYKLMPATVRWAMTEQLIAPNPCFEKVIKTHFWLKRDEVKQQVGKWIEETMGETKNILQKEAKLLFAQLDKLTPPIED